MTETPPSRPFAPYGLRHRSIPRVLGFACSPVTVGMTDSAPKAGWSWCGGPASATWHQRPRSSQHRLDGPRRQAAASDLTGISISTSSADPNVPSGTRRTMPVSVQPTSRRAREAHEYFGSRFRCLSAWPYPADPYLRSVVTTTYAQVDVSDVHRMHTALGKLLDTVRGRMPTAWTPAWRADVSVVT
jgi:hypothetical protein